MCMYLGHTYTFINIFTYKPYVDILLPGTFLWLLSWFAEKQSSG